MKPTNYYLLDTHTLVFWYRGTLSEEFILFLDNENEQGHLLVSALSFWEIALLSKKNRIEIDTDIEVWKNKLCDNTNIQIIEPSASEMIESVFLPDLHKDPFDRLLIVQAQNRNAILVSKDHLIQQYNVQTYWMTSSH